MLKHFNCYIRYPNFHHITITYMIQIQTSIRPLIFLMFVSCGRTSDYSFQKKDMQLFKDSAKELITGNFDDNKHNKSNSKIDSSNIKYMNIIPYTQELFYKIPVKRVTINKDGSIEYFLFDIKRSLSTTYRVISYKKANNIRLYTRKDRLLEDNWIYSEETINNFD